jgi:hypothetical protein
MFSQWRLRKLLSSRIRCRVIGIKMPTDVSEEPAVSNSFAIVTSAFKMNKACYYATHVPILSCKLPHTRRQSTAVWIYFVLFTLTVYRIHFNNTNPFLLTFLSFTSKDSTALLVGRSRDRFPVVSLGIFSVPTNRTMCPGVDSAAKNEDQGFLLG